MDQCKEREEQKENKRIESREAGRRKEDVSWGSKGVRKGGHVSLHQNNALSFALFFFLLSFSSVQHFFFHHQQAISNPQCVLVSVCWR